MDDGVEAILSRWSEIFSLSQKKVSKTFPITCTLYEYTTLSLHPVIPHRLIRPIFRSSLLPFTRTSGSCPHFDYSGSNPDHREFPRAAKKRP